MRAVDIAGADRAVRHKIGLFSKEECQTRLVAVRRAMGSSDVAFLLVSAPENIFYLTGLDHWGYFAPHILVVPADGDMLLVTRAKERVTIANQVQNASFEGHRDSETAADAIARALMKLWEGLSFALNFNVMFSQRGQLVLGARATSRLSI